MKKNFYSHIVEIDSVYTVLDVMDMTVEERQELIVIVDATVHHVVMNAVLSQLSESDKKLFLTHLAAENHDEIWSLLNEKVKDVEKKIRREVDKLKKELHEDMKKSLKKKAK
jgi:predicted dinucleotide-utilizing enzyme